MLTLANVRQFKNYLKELEIMTDEWLEVKERKHIFDTADDLQSAEFKQVYCPQDFFKFQLFDHYIELCKDKKGYYIYSENYKPNIPELLKLRVGYTSQYRIKDLDFENAKQVFECFCVDMIHVFFKHDSQLIYMY